MFDENILNRELDPSKRVGDYYPEYLLTLDEIFGTADYNGIEKLNVLELLLNSGIINMYRKAVIYLSSVLFEMTVYLGNISIYYLFNFLYICLLTYNNFCTKSRKLKKLFYKP